jgi:hypothetical protein
MPARKSFRNPLISNTVSLKNSTFLTSCLFLGFLAVVLQDHVTAQEDGAKTEMADNTEPEFGLAPTKDGTFVRSYSRGKTKESVRGGRPK